MEAQRLTTRTAGRVLADAVNRDRPFDHAAIVRYLAGKRASVEITEAFARARGVLPPPVIPGANTMATEWCDLGVRLQREAPTVFERELEELRQLVVLLERRRRGR
jgi:hypothetical protein